MRNPDLDTSLLTRVLHFTGAGTLSVATFYGVTALRLGSYNLTPNLALTGGLVLGSLAQFWMGEVLQHLSRIANPQRESAESREQSRVEVRVRD